MTLNAQQPMPFPKRLQWALGRLLRKVDPKGSLWWDVATFTWRGIVCKTCGRKSHTERDHITHDCDGFKHWLPPYNSKEAWQVGDHRCFYCLVHEDDERFAYPCSRRRPSTVELA